jgi:hypothetical protein
MSETRGLFRNDIDRVEEIARLALQRPASVGAPPTGPAGGALTGTFPNPGVNVGAGAPVTGVLPAANQAPQTLAGDTTGTTGANTVTKIDGASVPPAGALTPGNVLQVTGASALGYAPVNLAGGAAFVTGKLPVINQTPAQPLVPATLNGQIYFDPQNVTGVASDTAPPTITPTGQSVAGPVYRTFRGITSTWGTVSPLLDVATQVVQLSSHTDNTDPVVFLPMRNKGVIIQFTAAAPTVVASGVILASVTPKNRTVGANSDLRADIGASGVAGIMIQNTSRANSRSFAFRVVAGTVFELDQPFNPIAVPFAKTIPVLNDAWANGDSVNLLQPIQSNIAALDSLALQSDAPGTSGLYVNSITFWDPIGVRVSPCYIGRHVHIAECLVQKNLRYDSVFDSFNPRQNQNLHFLGFPGSSEVSTDQEPVFIGGAFTFGAALNGGFLDGDIILSGGAFNTMQRGSVIGNVYLDKVLSALSGVMSLSSGRYGTSIIYGSASLASLRMSGTARFTTNGQTFTATLTAPNFVTGTGILANTLGTIQTHTGANPDVINSGVGPSVANLDAAGVPGGFQLGGASFATSV